MHTRLQPRQRRTSAASARDFRPVEPRPDVRLPDTGPILTSGTGRAMRRVEGITGLALGLTVLIVAMSVGVAATAGQGGPSRSDDARSSAATKTAGGRSEE